MRIDRRLWPRDGGLIDDPSQSSVIESDHLDHARHLREKGQTLPRKTLGTFPRLSILVEGGELDLARSVITVVEDGGFDASNPNLMDGLVVFAHGELTFLASLEALEQGKMKSDLSGQAQERGCLLVQREAVTSVFVTSGNPSEGVHNRKHRIR